DFTLAGIAARGGVARLRGLDRGLQAAASLRRDDDDGGARRPSETSQELSSAHGPRDVRVELRLIAHCSSPSDPGMPNRCVSTIWPVTVLPTRTWHDTHRFVDVDVSAASGK